MKPNFTRLTRTVSVLLIAGLMTACPFGNKEPITPQDQLIDPSDSKRVGAALILPDGAITKDGTPPAPSTSSQAPKAVATVTDQPTTNGSTENVPVRYSNLNGGIGGAYAQVEGANNYYDIPVSGNAPSSGTINIPLGIPSNFRSGTFTLIYCIYDRSGRVSNILRIRFTITRVEPPKPGEGSVTIGGKTVKATAVCDLDFAQFGRGYAISINDSQIIVLYNMRQGSNQLGDFEALAGNSTGGVPTSPFALYFDGTTVYYSKSGTANANGKVVSASLVAEELFGGKRVSLSATGNCK